MSNLNRRNFLKTVSAATVGAGLGGVNGITKASTRTADTQNLTGYGKKGTNVVLIMVDDMGYEGLSCYGSLSYDTPYLDSLAERGARFLDCHSQPSCTPSRVKIMTGKYNLRNYVSFGVLKQGEKTFGNLFKENGYATAVAGKWQLYGGGDGQSPEDTGFDEYCLWAYNHRGSRYRDPSFNRNGEIVREVKGKYGPDMFSDFLCDFMERKKDQPFFVYYPMCLPHGPFEPTPDCPEWGQDINDAKFYKAYIEYMDKLVHKFEKKIEELGLAENTLLMFTSDNGTPRRITTKTDRRVVQGRKAHTCNGGTHVPLITYWKNHGGYGHECADLIDFSDILPTLADAANIDIPNSLQLDGRSFLPQICGNVGNRKDYFFVYSNPKQDRDRWPYRRWVRGSRFKLYNDGEFYDIQHDILEDNPLKDYEVAEHAKRLKAKYQSVLDRYADIESPDLNK